MVVSCHVFYPPRVAYIIRIFPYSTLGAIASQFYKYANYALRRLLLAEKRWKQIRICSVDCGGQFCWHSVWRSAVTRSAATGHCIYTHPFNSFCPGLLGWAGTRKVKPICILLKQKTVSGSGICWVICKSAPRSRQITMPAPHRSIFIDRMPFLSPNQQCQRYLSIPCLRSMRTRLQAGFLSEGCTRLSAN